MRGLALVAIVIIGLALMADRFERDVVSAPARVITPARPRLPTRTPTPRPALAYANALTPHVVSFEKNANAVLDALNSGNPIPTERAVTALAALAAIEQLSPSADMRSFHDAVLASLKLCGPMLTAAKDGDPALAGATQKLCSAGMYSAVEIITDMTNRQH